jgi:hypothetical protein
VSSSHKNRQKAALLRRLALPEHFIQPNTFREAFESNTAMVDKGEIFACDELMDDIGNQNLARLRTSTNAEGGMDGCAEQAAFR